ncbi:MAG: hypothetical protein QM727_00785 [Niabella sp.]
MNIKEILQEMLAGPYSKQSLNDIVEIIGDDNKRLDALLDLFLHGEYRITQKAAWVLGTVGGHNPEWIKKHLRTLLTEMQKTDRHPSIRRNITRILELVNIPEKHHGVVLDCCIRYISDPRETIATQSYALGILQKLSILYPEIRPEIKMIIENRMPDASPAFRSRAKAFLKSLKEG